MAQTITKDNFDSFVLQSDKPVLVDFWAPWCGPCKMLGPVVDEVAAEYKDQINIGKVNVDEQQELAVEYKVSSIPTLVLFQNGKVVKTELGFKPKEQLVKFFSDLI